MRKFLAAGIAAGLIAALAGIAPAQAVDNNHGDGGRDRATLTVLNALPDRTVDVYIDHKLRIDNLDPGDFSKTLKLRDGDHTVSFKKADSRESRDGRDGRDRSRTIVGPVDISLDSGTDYTLVAHLTKKDHKTTTLFENNTDSVKRGSGVLTVRHVAAAGAVDVRADNRKVASGLKNGDEASKTLKADSYELRVSKEGKRRTIIDPTDVDVNKRENTIVYIWGSAKDDNLDLATQSVDLDR